jgi:hypothetical protein
MSVEGDIVRCYQSTDGPSAPRDHQKKVPFAMAVEPFASEKGIGNAGKLR